MKRIICILVIVMFAGLVIGCAPSASEESPAKESPAKKSPAEESLAEESPAEESSAEGEITLGHLSYATGPFGHLGPMFDGSVEFTLGFVNENPPLGRTVRALHEDKAVIGEAQLVRQFVESAKVDMIYNTSSEYYSYREYILDYIQTNARPLLPSIHAGAIDAALGGTVEEPMFRGSPMDTDQAVVAALHLADQGAKSVVVVAVENEGMQMQQDAAVQACNILGIEVLGEIDIQPEATSYRSEATQAAAMNPDAIILYGAAEDAGTFVKNAAELGISAMWVGETNTGFPEFLTTATLEAIQAQKFVKYVTFTNAENEAWDFFAPEWKASMYADIADASNSYVISAYDLINLTMLAIEKGGSLNPEDWVPAMYEVSMGPGKKVYTYEEGITALRNGEEIDYDGVTGTCDYTNTGVISAIWLIMDWSSGEMTADSFMDGERVLEISAQIKY